MRKLPIVEIEWNDTSGLTGWHTEENHISSGVALCRTVGYLLKSGRKEVVVAASFDTRKHSALKVLDSTIIPRGCITKITRLK